MKIALSIYFLILAQVCASQVFTSKTQLTRYIKNVVQIDGRFQIDTTGIPDVKIVKLSDSKKLSEYAIIPYTKQPSINLVVRSKRKSEKHALSFTLNDPNFSVEINYPKINDKMDVSVGLDKIEMKIWAQSVDGLTFFRVTKFDLIYPEGNFKNTDFKSIQDFINITKPDSIVLTNLSVTIEKRLIQMPDNVTVNLSYPPRGDLQNWCKSQDQETLLIEGAAFKENTPDTLQIYSSTCLYLRLDDSGTENDFVLQSLDNHSRIVVKEFCCGLPIPLLSTMYLNGMYKIQLSGDGDHSGYLYLNVKSTP